MNQAIAQTLKTIYNATQKALDESLFEPNVQDAIEFAIQNVALAFEAPNFIAVTVCGQKYGRSNKSDFIEDMRMHFADNPDFVIDGMFEYKIVPALPCITFTVPEKYKGKTFAEVMDSL